MSEAVQQVMNGRGDCSRKTEEGAKRRDWMGTEEINCEVKVIIMAIQSYY